MINNKIFSFKKWFINEELSYKTEKKGGLFIYFTLLWNRDLQRNI